MTIVCSRELCRLVDDGLLEMGVNGQGEAVFWATEKGRGVLGMDLN